MGKQGTHDRKLDAMKDYSQYGEQPIIHATLEAIGITKGHLVDLGAGDGYYLSNSRGLLEKGWTGDLYDGDPKGAKDVTKMWITEDSLFGKLKGHTAFLSIDLDGNDYHVLRYCLGSSHGNRIEPSLIVCEINPIFGRDEAKVMPYNADHVWKGDTYYGGSLAAFEKLGKEFGYIPMYLHHSLNLFLLRNDHAKAHPELIKPIEYKQKWNHARHNPELPWITLS